MIIYFTTCNQKLYDVSCKALINSFILTCETHDKLYVFHENVNIDVTCSKVIYVNVANCKFYNDWFTKFKDHIPQKFGGNVNTIEDSRMMYGHAVKWNQKACLWFWKIVSMHNILEYITSEVSHFVFLDADTFFQSALTSEFFEKLLPIDCSVGYHLGKFRRNIEHRRCAGVESGILVFRNSTDSFQFINDLIEIFTSGSFLNYVRWDDGYILRMLIEQEKHENYCYDFVSKSNIKNVISEGPFKGKIIHEIGKHFRLKVDQ